jgi:hypothetical protein
MVLVLLHAPGGASDTLVQAVAAACKRLFQREASFTNGVSSAAAWNSAPVCPLADYALQLRARPAIIAVVRSWLTVLQLNAGSTRRRP